MASREMVEELQARVNSCEEAELASLSRVGRFLNSILDVDELLRAILEEALDAVGAMRGFVRYEECARREHIHLPAE